MDRYTGPPEDSAASLEAAESNLNNSQRMITVRMPDPLPQQLIEKLIKFVNTVHVTGLTREEKDDARSEAVAALLNKSDRWLETNEGKPDFNHGYVGRAVKNKMFDILRQKRITPLGSDVTDEGRGEDRLLTKLAVQDKVERLLDPMREHVLHTVNFISEWSRAFPRESMHFNPEDQSKAVQEELEQWNPDPARPLTPRVRDIIAKLRRSWN